MTTPNFIPKAGDLLFIREAVEFLALRVQLVSDSARSKKDKLRKRIVYAIKNGNLRSDDGKRVQFGDLAAWAFTHLRWQEQIRGLPMNAIARPMGVDTSIKMGQPMAVATTPPDTLEACHQALHAANVRIAELMRENELQAAEIVRLRPFWIFES